ncbi:hypothetical protein [Lederbergia citri]|uniref:Uncharacterized protein n=1 Tax=Lederbergia citri TaxID=2833580 RepID=A0A942YHE3_9BACI|nr:hypothetical protein [Lederbergia citri]MBS4195335.1 hypothetical protein [Lederbergia citri]
MANVKVKTVGAIVNGQPIGSTVEMTKAEAEHYEKLGYVEVVKTTPKSDEKGKSAPKKSETKAESKPKTKDDK